MTDPDDDGQPRWRLLQRMDALLLGVAALFLAGYLTTVVLQVFVRYVLEYALPWTEEVGVYLFVWSAFMAAAVVVGRNGHFSVSLVAGWLGRRQQRTLAGPRRRPVPGVQRHHGLERDGLELAHAGDVLAGPAAAAGRGLRDRPAVPEPTWRCTWPSACGD